jgi:hypothetical protein
MKSPCNVGKFIMVFPSAVRLGHLLLIVFDGMKQVSPCASSSPALHFFQIVLIVSTILSTGMTSISLCMQWPLISQQHGSFLK